MWPKTLRLGLDQTVLGEGQAVVVVWCGGGGGGEYLLSAWLVAWCSQHKGTVPPENKGAPPAHESRSRLL